MRSPIRAPSVAFAALAVVVTACVPPGPGASSGTLETLTYNVAGLPQGISSSNPEVNTRLIGPLLNGYDLVCVQEDFWYHLDLEAGSSHPYRTWPQGSTFTWSNLHFMNDGLNRFGNDAMGDLTRVTWTDFHGHFDSGSDGLAAKGFSHARHELAPGITIDVYNHHADAGGGPGDVQAREKQFQQLAAFIQRESAGRAVLVLGDTNLKGTVAADEKVLQQFLAATGLTDAGRYLGQPADPIDRILFRTGGGVALTPRAWRVAAEFVDPAGAPLSDHDAIHVTIDWRSNAP